ncbi:DeoR/GlpR family DNA-binding transcription regulator [Enterococcus alishanensis]|uniref:DeoR/GlpR family DNA-binding transcription regulator n=1 Tax=Enterococcus alishanensis TaxID=1303817 RepID=A0ABS6THQ4_9ENTE|nr:DeoR/GlpR family DNA-binding transcription regulator [Enterococcus alishanensis]MBV7392506.1 DeoR/GlpR family DNA-binding transcription regulator [Enterococcus alishanensis]
MNLKERQKYILKKLKQQGTATTNELVNELKVSKMTINRDFSELEKLGVVELFHGGAMYIDTDIVEYPIHVKNDIFVNEKKKIAKKVSSLIDDGHTIFLETGTTVSYAAKELKGKRSSNFFTNSLSIMKYFSTIEDLKLNIIPGTYRPLSDGFLGVDTLDYIDNLFFDYCILGVEGISENGRLSVQSKEDAFVKQKIITHSKNKILLFDKSKINKNFTYSFGTINQFDKIITDYQNAQNLLENYLVKKDSLIIAGT